jgi:superfamily II DNA or RNA helicase
MKYLGKNGFTIQKSDLSQTKLFAIKDELTVKPYNNSGMGQTIQYPIYRESTNKIYVPRYYGIEKFEKYDKSLLSDGEDISLNFKGNLFDYQVNIVNKFINHVGEEGGGLLDVEPGKGKTVMALNIISKLNKKTLVIVHKSFLLNQWKERIEQFLPGAKIGHIQGQIVDIEGKDIVIGMLQTLSTKTFSDDIIRQFGLCVYDECHHLSAEVFSNVMIKIVTKYNLGLSGTMTRKDGLTKVFKYFIGPVVHKEKTDNNIKVLIKAAYFNLDDEEYNDVEIDYRGNVMYSRMITKISENEYRRNFIENILKLELKNNNDQQIMILAHTKSLINDLYERVCQWNSSVGLYLGGMKEHELKESEGKQVIIATYSMASEGLDIKTLTTLLMATPKSDVCQSVGRILRSKHSNPLVIDIVDQHEVFKKQFDKRKTYYNKKEYIINKYIGFDNYKNDIFTEIHKKKKTAKKSLADKKYKCLIDLSM